MTNNPEMTTAEVREQLEFIRRQGGQRIVGVRMKDLMVNGGFVKFQDDVLTLDIGEDQYRTIPLENIIFIRYRNATEANTLPVTA